MMALFIIALLSMPTVAFILGQVWLGSAFTIFYLILIILELIAKKITGKTLSQKVWVMPLWKRWILASAMILGWGALIIHFLSHQ